VNAILAVITQPWFLATVAPAIPLLILAIAFQPRPLRPAKHYTGVRATRPARALIARCEAEWAARPHPTGWQSPAWTVQS
jgi:hypothetical protein